VFHSVDQHAWGRLMRWIRNKYRGKNRLGMTELRRRFCDKGWRIAHKGVVFTGASSVAMTRYRHRGSNIRPPGPETGSRHQRLTNGQDTWRARCGESRAAGSAGGPWKPTESNLGRAPRSDPAHANGGIIQVATVPDGWPIWTSDVRPGREHGPPQRQPGPLAHRPHRRRRIGHPPLRHACTTRSRSVINVLRGVTKCDISPPRLLQNSILLSTS
jgi:hypothetical protein